MVKRASSLLLSIIDKRDPTEKEAQELTLRLVDDGGMRGEIDLSPEIVIALKEKALIYYCENCTGNTIRDNADNLDEHTDYTAAEYHLVAFYYGIFGSHTYRCIAESGIEVPGIETMMGEEDELCDMCKAARLLIPKEQ